MRAWLAALAACAIALVACGRSAVDDATSPAPLRPAVRYGELDVDGQRRTYRVFAPPTVGSGPPVPLVVALHGSFGNAEAFRDITQFDRAATAGNFVVVYPESVGDSWNAGFCCGVAPEEGIDDVGFAAKVLDELAGEYPIDPTRVYAVGASAGGIMAYALGCEMADRITGVAVVGATMVMDDCVPERPVSVLALHGTEDGEVPYHGGPTSGSSAPAPAQPALMAMWAERNGCAGVATTITDGPVTRSNWEGCQEGSFVRLVAIEGGGHTWFSSDFSGVAASVDATDAITKQFGLAPP